MSCSRYGLDFISWSKKKMEKEEYYRKQIKKSSRQSLEKELLNFILLFEEGEEKLKDLQKEKLKYSIITKFQEKDIKQIKEFAEKLKDMLDGNLYSFGTYYLERIITRCNVILGTYHIRGNPLSMKEQKLEDDFNYGLSLIPQEEKNKILQEIFI